MKNTDKYLKIALAALLLSCTCSYGDNGGVEFINLDGGSGSSNTLNFVYKKDTPVADIPRKSFEVKLTNAAADFEGKIELKNESEPTISVYDAATAGTKIDDPEVLTISGGAIDSGQTTTFYVQAAGVGSQATISAQLYKKDEDGNLAKKGPLVKITVNLLPVEFITPAGDPLSAPVDSGTAPASIPDGANEFTFSSDEDPTTAKLTMKLKVKVPGIVAMSSAEQAKFAFELDSIGNSKFEWDDPSNANGKPTVNGDFLTATATYTRLPLNNSDFGLKKARIKYDGTLVSEANFEVFYPAYASNFPRTSDAPNWYYYYKDNEGGTDYTLAMPGQLPNGIGGGSDYGVPGSVIIAKPAVDGTNRYHETKIEAGFLKRTGSSDPIKYYASFVAVLAHEREHANKQRPNTSSENDADNDHCYDDYEVNTMKTKPDNPNTADPEFKDDEVYAGGPIEESAYNAADTSQDWANPGSNFGEAQP